MRIGSTERTFARASVLIMAAVAALAVLGLAGCAGTGKKHVLPEDGPTMYQIYDDHFAGMRSGNVQGARARLGQPVQGRGIRSAHLDLAGYTKDEVVGRDWFQLLVPGGHQPGVGTGFSELMDQGTESHYENPLVGEHDGVGRFLHHAA